MNVVEQRLAQHAWLVDEFSIADIAVFPWVRTLIGFYGAGDLVEIQRFPHVLRALEAFEARPGVARGLRVLA